MQGRERGGGERTKGSEQPITCRARARRASVTISDSRSRKMPWRSNACSAGDVMARAAALA